MVGSQYSMINSFINGICYREERFMTEMKVGFAMVFFSCVINIMNINNMSVNMRRNIIKLCYINTISI